MRKLNLYLTGLCLLLGIGVNAQTILSENFNTASGTTPPTGWVQNFIAGSTSNTWFFNNPKGRTLTSPISSPAAIFDSDYLGYYAYFHNVALESPSMNTTGKSVIRLKFDHYFYKIYNSFDSIAVEVYNGSTWNNVYSSKSTSTISGNIDIDISAYAANKSSTKVRFRFVGDYSWYWIVDNVEVYEVPPCSGTPSPGNTLSTVNPVCNSATSFTLSLQNPTSGTGLTYQWQSSPNGTTWSNILGATSSTLTTTQSSSTYYRCNVTCGLNTGPSNALQVTNSFLACYCTAANTSGCTFGDNISNVTLGTLNNSSGCVGGSPAYIDYGGSVSAPNLNIGSTNSMSVSVGSGGTEHVAVWIDYDHSGSFDASEYTYLGNGTSSGAITNNVVIAPTALTGVTKMRVRVRYSSSTTPQIAATNACTNFSWGETEDYNVNLVCPAITVTTHPANTTICPNGNGSFTVTPNPGTGLTATYKWEVSTNGGSTWSTVTNGGVYSGATTATLNLTAAPSTMSGYQYRCVATNNCNNTVTSNAATLSFYTLPVVTVDPTNKSACLNSSTTFSTTVTGASLNYQWQVSTNGGSTWTDITNGGNYVNATTSTLTVTAITSGMNNYQYRCVAKNTCSATTASATLTVLSLPAIVSSPSPVTICTNANTSFTASGTGTGITYQWQVSTNNGVSFSDISNTGVYSNATTATLNLTSVPASMDGYLYRCRIDGTCAPSVFTGVAKLTIGANPVVTAHPQSKTICTGTTGSTEVTATGYNITYQWEVSTNGGSTWGNVTNGGIYSGATTSTLSFINPTLADNGNMYRCVVTNACIVSVTSNAMTLTVATSPVVNTQPTNKTICVGDNTSYTVAATSSGSIAYQWQGSNDGVTWSNLFNGGFGVFSGVNTATLNLTTPYVGLYSMYRCELNTGCIPAVTSNAATLTIHSQPVISLNPSSQVKCVGQNATFSVGATGSNITHQWQISTNGGSTWANVTNGGGYSGATTFNLAVSNVQASQSGYRYRCVVSGSCPTAKTSGTATLTVNTPVALTANTPASLTLCSGANTSLTVGATGTGVSYRWYINNNGTWTALNNGGFYSGVTASTLNITGITASPNTKTYVYQCRVTGTCNAVTSNTTYITVHAKPAITSNPANVTKCDSTTNVSFSVGATGTAITYQWQINTGSGWFNLSNNSTYSGVATATLAMPIVYYSMNGYQYRCIITGTCAPALTTSVATLTVNKLVPTSVTFSASDEDICAGTSVTFTASPVNGGSNPTYVWKRNGTAIGTGNPFSTSTLGSGNLIWCEMTSNALCPSPKTVASSNTVAMKVTQYSTPTITITSDHGSSWCSGKDNVFRATITNGGDVPTYEWLVNGQPVGASADTYLTNQLVNGDKVSCRLTSNLVCPSPQTVTSNVITMTINQTNRSSIVIAPNPDSVVCDKAEVTMYTFFTNGGTTPSFQWVLNGADIPGETMGTLKTTGLSNGDVVQCRFISSATCVFPEMSNPVTFNVVPLVNPSVTIAVYSIGEDTYRFVAIPKNGGLNPSYQWYKNTVAIPGATAETYDAIGLAMTDKIHVEMSSSEECVNPELLTVSSRNITTGVEKFANGFSELGLYPNPNGGQFHIKGALNKPVSNKEVVVKISNSLGQVVFTKTYPASGSTIDLPVVLNNDLANGMYQVNIVIDGEVSNLRFVLNR